MPGEVYYLWMKHRLVSNDQFGKEAIETLMEYSYMTQKNAPKGESPANAPIMIFAGYENEMLGYCEKDSDNECIADRLDTQRTRH